MAAVDRQLPPATCPRGHANLVVRCVVDFPAVLGLDGFGGSSVWPDEAAPDVQSPGSLLGVDSGCWCEECSERYFEHECSP
jgi:hypothetical protein